MSYTLKQTRRFARAYKKLHPNVAADVAMDSVAGYILAVDVTARDVQVRGPLAGLARRNERPRAPPGQPPGCADAVLCACSLICESAH